MRSRLKHLLPPSKLDLPLFVAELRDFGRTFDSVRKTLVNGKALATREMSRAGVVGGTWAADFGLKAFGSMTFKQIKSLARSPRAVVHELVGLDLYWKFALKPFLDGCLTMSNMMRDLEEMRNSLANPKPFRVRGTAKSLTTSPSTGTDTGVYRYDRVIERSDEAHAWALVRRRPYEASHWDAFKKVYAIRPRPSLAYSVATLSFVFDWFVNVGRFLRQFERPMVKDLDLEILDTAWSVKRTEVYSDKLHFTVTSGAAGCPVPSGELVGVASTTGTQYLRSTSELLLDSSYIEPVQIGFPDAGKVWSGVELILSAMTR